MSSLRVLFFALPVALGFIQPAAAKQRAFSLLDKDADGFIDPVEFAGNAKGRAWNKAMSNFEKRDADDDGLLSSSEYGPAKSNGGGLYYVPGEQEAIPLKWTTGVNFIWQDGTASKKERRSFKSTLKKAAPAQREELQAYWDAVEAAVLEAGADGAIGAIAEVWGQIDPEAAAEWISSILHDIPEYEDWIIGIVSGWPGYDPDATAEWLAGILDGLPLSGIPVRPEPPSREP